jgi:hypothetical protein
LFYLRGSTTTTTASRIHIVHTCRNRMIAGVSAAIVAHA